MAYDWKADLPGLEAKYKLPPGLLGALVRQESGGRVNVTSPAGAYGLTQLMPATAKGLGVNPRDPRQNLEGGAKYLAQQLRTFKSVPKALAAYNAGPGAVQKYGGVPPYKETQGYVKNVSKYWKESSRYGQKPGQGGTPTRRGVTVQQGASQAPQKPILGGARQVEQVEVPMAMAAPTRREVMGLDEQSVAKANQVWQDDPGMAQAWIDRRQREQNKFDMKYMGEQTAYEANEASRAAAQQTNMLSQLMPNKYPEGGVAGTPTRVTRPGSIGSMPGGSWNSKSKFVRTPGGWVRNHDDGEQSYKFLSRLSKGFGLNPGSTIRPGAITASGNRSNHADARAVDFGDKSNSRDRLFSFAQWAKKNAGMFNELYYTPLGWSIKNGKVVNYTIGGHDDHLHAAR